MASRSQVSGRSSSSSSSRNFEKVVGSSEKGYEDTRKCPPSLFIPRGGSVAKSDAEPDWSASAAEDRQVGEGGEIWTGHVGRDRTVASGFPSPMGNFYGVQGGEGRMGGRGKETWIGLFCPGTCREPFGLRWGRGVGVCFLAGFGAKFDCFCFDSWDEIHEGLKHGKCRFQCGLNRPKWLGFGYCGKAWNERGLLRLPPFFLFSFLCRTRLPYPFASTKKLTRVVPQFWHNVQ